MQTLIHATGPAAAWRQSGRRVFVAAIASRTVAEVSGWLGLSQPLVPAGARVDETPERHVAGDAVEAVEPSDGGHDGSLAPAVMQMRAAAHAAPKPLSIPTTVTPDAHDANMASRAVMPSRALP